MSHSCCLACGVDTVHWPAGISGIIQGHVSSHCCSCTTLPGITESTYILCLSHFVISSNEIHGSWSLALLSIMRRTNSAQFRERFKAKDMLINLQCMRHGLQCMSPGHVMKPGQLFKICYFSTASRCPWRGGGQPLLSSADVLCTFFPLAPF